MFSPSLLSTPILSPLLRLLFPSRCPSCDGLLSDPRALACERCAPTIFRLEGPLCPTCAMPQHAGVGSDSAIDVVCSDCTERPPPFDGARACWEYDGVVASALQGAKYAGALWKLRVLGEHLRPWLLECLAEFNRETTCIAPVPMHPSRLRERGFNAALLLARFALEESDWAACLESGALEKARVTVPQAGLGRAERLENVKGSFEVEERSLVRGKTWVLFDDVLTTGATARAASRALLEAGANSVAVVTAARAVGSTHGWMDPDDRQSMEPHDR